MSEYVDYINNDVYDETIASGLVVVDFYSTECPPCEALSPKFEGVAELYGEHVKFYKIFRQENRELAEKLGVKSSPTVLFYKDGKQVGDMISGGIKRSELIAGVEAILDNQELSDSLKASVPKKNTECDVMILGGGPGGLAAGIYTAQAKVKTIIVDKALPGGQVSTTHQVSNYPGFVEPQPGFMLAHFMSEQAKSAGVEYRAAVEITGLDLVNKTVEIDAAETITAKKIILATGASPRPLGVPGETEYKGKGLSYCATCDAKYFDDQEVIVIGGGNSAVEEAMYITKFAKKVTVVHQFDKLQANKEAQEKAFANDKIEFIFEHEPREFIKTERGMDVVVEDLKKGERKTLSAEGVFIFIGMVPNLEGLEGMFDMDDWGYIKVDQLQHTSVKDVFAVGDVASKPYRQITVAVAEGTVAAIQAAREIEQE